MATGGAHAWVCAPVLLGFLLNCVSMVDSGEGEYSCDMCLSSPLFSAPVALANRLKLTFLTSHVAILKVVGCYRTLARVPQQTRVLRALMGK